MSKDEVRPRGGFSRRHALRVAGAVAAVAAGGTTLAACAASAATGGSSAAGKAPALPQPYAGATVLYFQPNYQGAVQWNQTTKTLYQQFVDQNFNNNPAYKGIWAKVYPSGWGNAAGQIAATLAGSGYADIVLVCCSDVPTLEQAHFLTPLNELMKQDNLDPLALFSKGHLEADSLAGTLYGLPSYDGTTCIFYGQDILDQLGLQYPSPNWTYTEAEQIWTASAGTVSAGGKQAHRAGVSLYWNSPYEMINWWMHGWGATEMDPQQTRATMASAQGAACLSYAVGMAKSGVAVNARGLHQILNNQAVFVMAHSSYVVNAAEFLGNKIKWNILPMPVWPAGRATFVTIDMYGMNNATKHPKETWELMKWINIGAPKGNGFDPAWPKFQIQVNLITPALKSLWSYWEQTITQVAPPLKGKDLKWFADASLKGYGYPTIFFKYQPVAATNVVNTWFNQAWSGQVSPQLALQQMQTQINALEVAGAQETGLASSATKAFPVKGNAIAAVTPGL